jgi:hypothetical protein
METVENKKPFLLIRDVLVTTIKCYRKQIRNILPIIILFIIPCSIAENIFLHSSIIRIVGGLISYIPTIAIILLAYSEFQGESITWVQTLKMSLSKYLNVLMANIYASITIIIFSIFLIIPGIIWYVYLVFTLQAATIKDLRNNEALAYSQKLVQGQWWKIFLYTIIISIPSLIPGIVFLINQLYMKIDLPIMILLIVIGSIIQVYVLLATTILFLRLEQTKENNET